MSEEDKITTNFKGNLVDYIAKLTKERDLYKNVVDEIKKVINNQINYREFVDIVNAIEEILDKVGD